MAYSNPSGRRPFERASKASHHHIIKDEVIQNLLGSCIVPPPAHEVSVNDRFVMANTEMERTSIEFIISIDGGSTEIPIREEFPSAKLAFFQFGALLFRLSDLAEVELEPFLGPEDMARLKKLERFKLALPLRNIRTEGSIDLIESVRKTIYYFFKKTIVERKSLISTLKWLLFEEFRGLDSEGHWNLATNPYTEEQVLLKKKDITDDFIFSCPVTGKPIFITDVFRFHEVIDNELGAGGIVGYLINTIELLLIVHIIRILLEEQPDSLNRILFFKDGPLGFFGQTARLHLPVRMLIKYLKEHHNVNLVGVEKSGPFVEHAWEIRDKIPPGNALLLNNEYIYRYILPGRSVSGQPYGSTSLFGHKAIYRSREGYVFVLSTPACEIKTNPQEEDYINLQIALASLERLQCHMYDNALVPITLANKLVSLAAHPSQRILERFARQILGRQ